MRRFCDAKKHQGEGTCRQAAGWGTSHPGSGHCKLHGGATKQGAKGADNPNFKHGLYAEHMSPEELVGFEEWSQRFELSRVGPDDLYALYRLQKGLAARGPIPLGLLAQTVNLLASTRVKYRKLVEGEVLKVDLTDELLQTIMTGYLEILLEFVPKERLVDAAAALQNLARRGSVRGSLSEPEGGAVPAVAKTDDPQAAAPAAALEQLTPEQLAALVGVLAGHSSEQLALLLAEALGQLRPEQLGALAAKASAEA